MNLPWQKGPPGRVFITGGGSGIGRELACRLAGEGTDVAVFNRKLAPQVLAELRKSATRAEQRFESYVADVAQDDSIRSAINRAVAELGKPDLVINSAGIQIAKPFDQLSGEEFDRLVATNLGGSR